MAANNETKVQKSNTLEQWRVKTNEVSHNLGDVDLLDSRLTDQIFNFTGNGTQFRFGASADNDSKTLRIELQPENQIDAVSTIILTGSPSLTGFVADVVVFQGSVGSETFTGQINYINQNKIVLRNTTGTFDASADLKFASNTIGNANLVRLISESFNTGYARIKSNNVSLVQDVGIGSQNGFHIVNFSLEVALSGSPSIPSTFTEGATLYQGSVGSETFSGTLLEATTTHLRFKVHTGTFSTSVMVKQSESAGDRILAASLNTATLQDTAIGSMIELHTPPSNSHALVINTQNIVDSITEVQDDIGEIGSLGTINKTDIVSSINELETVSRAGNSDYTLGTTAQNFRDAINELETASRGANANYTLGTDAQNFKDGINELETALRGTTGNYTIGTDSNDVVGAINEIETALRGNVSNYTLGTTATNIVAGINEIETALRGTGSNYTLNTAANDVISAINEHETDIGTVGNLTTSATNLTLAINELDLKQGAASLTTSATTLSGAINEHETQINTLDTNHLNRNLAANVNQDVNGSITFKGDSVDFSNTTALFSAAGGVANFGSAFVNLNATSASGSNVNLQGLQVDRTAISGGAPTHDVRLIWNEGLVATKPARAWQLRGMADDKSDNTADIVTFYNAEDLIQNNSESGIAVTWDSTNQNFDFNVNDPTLTFTGDVTGSGTLTNLGNLSVALTVQPNSVALGTDTTGNYISTIAGTSNQITVTGSGSETSAVTLSLPSNVAISGEMEAGSLDINGNFDISGNGTIHGNTTIGGTLDVNGNVTLGNSTSDTVTIAGDLIVQGDETKLNVSTLEVEDILILTGSSTTTLPTTGGFGFETKLFSGRANQTINSRTWSAAGKHPNAASNVTGSHSIVFNFGYDPGGGAPKGRWEMDGSPLLSAATLGSPLIEGAVFEQGDNLNFVAGTGMTLSTGKSGTTHTVEFTNDDRGSAQNIYKQFAADSGAMAVANNNNDTLTIRGGNGLHSVSTGTTDDIITIHHDDTSSQNSVNNSGGTVIQSVVLDTFGHVTSLGSTNLDTRFAGINNTVNLTGNQTINGTKTFNSTISGSINGNAATITNQANSATITATTSGSANLIALRDGSGQLTAARFLGPITPSSGANGVLITHSDIRSASSSNWTGDPGTQGKIQYHSNRWYIVADSSSNRIVQFRRNNADVSFIDNSGNYVGNVTGNVSGNAGTISSQANSATITATSSNVANQIVLRNGNGDFSARIITATTFSGNLTGNASGSSSSCTGNAATATTASNSTNVNVLLTTDGTFYQLAFTSGTGNNRVRSRTNGTGFRYQPSTDTLTGSRLNANLSGSHSYAYSNLTGKPTIPTNNNQLTNGANYVTSSGVTSVATGNGLSGGTITTTGTLTMSGSYSGSFSATGDITANTSDERLKDFKGNIDNALDKIDKIGGYYFNWNDTAKGIDSEIFGDELEVGVNAQEILAIMPEVIAPAPIVKEHNLDIDYKTVRYEKLVPLLIEAIKELKAEIEDLKSINS